MTPDEEGLVFSSIERVQEEAARSLADMAKDVAARDAGNNALIHLEIDVRDDIGPVLQAKFSFNMRRLRH